MESPLISIVIPLHNEEKYIEECIISIKTQSYTNFECIFIDDGSTDKSHKIISCYSNSDNRFKLYSKKHSGLIPSINMGIAKSTGKIICRMDGDDIMPQKRLELQLQKLQNCGKKSLFTGKVKYFSNTLISKGYKEYENWLNSLNTPDDYIKNCFIECPVAAPSWMMFKTDVENLNCFDENIYPEDYNFILKAITNGIKIHSISETVLLWRDYHTRTSKILDDYSRNNFRKVRSLHLKNYIKTFTKHSSFVIFGVGSNGKELCKVLQENKIIPDAFIDVHPERIGKKILGIPVYHFNNTATYNNHFILIALRDKKVKQKIAVYLNNLNKQEAMDYIFCC